MSQQIANEINERFSHLLQQNTHASDAEFIARLALALGPDWHLISKSAGENGYTWPNGIRTSHDAIFRVNARGAKVEGRDCIAASGTGTPTRPTFGEIPPEHWRDSNRPVKVSDVFQDESSTPPGPTGPTGPSEPPTDLQVTLRQVAELHATLPTLLNAAKTVLWLKKVNGWPDA